uniref:Uncharacterized protein n=1 Tax=Cacopsylla melanoneura TaxID=428564 RepID=A0A8D8YGC1_9HEMI
MIWYPGSIPVHVRKLESSWWTLYLLISMPYWTHLSIVKDTYLKSGIFSSTLLTVIPALYSPPIFSLLRPNLMKKIGPGWANIGTMCPMCPWETAIGYLSCSRIADG